jgi:hemolysin III
MWRGRVHLFALLVFVPAVVWMTAESVGVRPRVGTAIYGLGICSMFAASAAYHRWVHGLRARAIWRRIDHAVIFAAIAGSATPLALTVMDASTGLALVVALWATALVGVALKMSRWHHGDVAGTVLYFVLSAECAVLLPSLARDEGPTVVALCLAASALYVIGSILFALKVPTLTPGVFGYHEVWHVFTVLAATTHFAAVWMVVT